MYLLFSVGRQCCRSLFGALLWLSLPALIAKSVNTSGLDAGSLAPSLAFMVK